jgi:hypothetical protein
MMPALKSVSILKNVLMIKFFKYDSNTFIIIYLSFFKIMLKYYNPQRVNKNN